jgi:predicted nucleic acid-binding protein
MNQRIFVDSDVIIAALLSPAGASHLFLYGLNKPNQPFISTFSLKELNIVTKRLNIDQKILSKLVKKIFTIVKINQTFSEIIEKYSLYVFDRYDAHIVAGAVESKSRFLITYNTKDYKIEEIKRKFGILIFKPAQYLQYLRSIQSI